MLNTLTKVHSALLLRDISDNEDIDDLLLGQYDILKWLLGNGMVVHVNQ